MTWIVEFYSSAFSTEYRRNRGLLAYTASDYWLRSDKQCSNGNCVRFCKSQLFALTEKFTWNSICNDNHPYQSLASAATTDWVFTEHISRSLPFTTVSGNVSVDIEIHFHLNQHLKQHHRGGCEPQHDVPHQEGGQFDHIPRRRRSLSSTWASLATIPVSTQGNKILRSLPYRGQSSPKVPAWM